MYTRQKELPFIAEDGQCNLSYCLEQILLLSEETSVTFEHFHAWHEVMKSLLFPADESKTSLSFHYKLKHDRDPGPKLKPLRFKSVRMLKEHFPSPGPLLDQKSEEIIHLDRFVLLPPGNNPAFGIVFFAKKDDGSGHIAICIECQYSYISEGTKLTEEVSSKVAQLKKAWQPFVRDGENVGEWFGKDDSTIGRLKMDLNDSYLVIIAFRDDFQLQQLDTRRNVIILDKEHLQRHYTPSLSQAGLSISL